ncbi:hypothetical protein A7X75_07170 [Stenotrophomonas maltophilia]|nr:hypothetical protein A7X75_07170 [Stenotrophomonas maltophilia]
MILCAVNGHCPIATLDLQADARLFNAEVIPQRMTLLSPDMKPRGPMYPPHSFLALARPQATMPNSSVKLAHTSRTCTASGSQGGP